MEVIFVPFSGEERIGDAFAIEISHRDTILDIKMKIHSYHGYPAAAQILVANGTKLRDENKTAEYYRIRHRSRVELYIDPNFGLWHLVNVEVNIKKSISFRAFRTMTIDQVKERVRKLLIELLTDDLYDQSELQYNRRALIGHQNLADCSLDGDLIKLVMVPGEASSSGGHVLRL